VAERADHHDFINADATLFSHTMSTRKPYEGLSRGLVIGIDVGTTFSGVSYCILDPGTIPIIQGVNRWVSITRAQNERSLMLCGSYPAQERVGGDAKIPSVLYYDQQGLMRAAGAEALHESYLERAVDEDWVKTEW
jgi:molecular chaperone DnaK (HSP70)